MKTPLSAQKLTESDCWAYSRAVGTVVGLCMKCTPGCVSLQKRHREVFKGSTLASSQNWAVNGHCAGCLNPLFHQPASVFAALYPAYAYHFLAHFSSCCLQYDFTAKEPFLSQFLWCKGKGRQMLLGLQLHELPEWVTSYICFFTQCESKK